MRKWSERERRTRRRRVKAAMREKRALAQWRFDGSSIKPARRLAMMARLRRTARARDAAMPAIFGAEAQF